MKKSEITTEVIREAKECLQFLWENQFTSGDEKMNIAFRITKRQDQSRRDVTEDEVEAKST